jgi:hypothetical protein
VKVHTPPVPVQSQYAPQPPKDEIRELDAKDNGILGAEAAGVPISELPDNAAVRDVGPPPQEMGVNEKVGGPSHGGHIPWEAVVIETSWIVTDVRINACDWQTFPSAFYSRSLLAWVVAMIFIKPLPLLPRLWMHKADLAQKEVSSVMGFRGSANMGPSWESYFRDDITGGLRGIPFSGLGYPGMKPAALVI